MKKLIVLVLLCIPLAGMALTPVGTPVKKINFANHIDGWRMVDDQHLILSTGPSRHYLIELNRECHFLSFARNVGVSTSNNTIYSGFDHITVDGIPFGIKTIVRVDKAQMRALTRA